MLYKYSTSRIILPWWVPHADYRELAELQGKCRPGPKELPGCHPTSYWRRSPISCSVRIACSFRSHRASHLCMAVLFVERWLWWLWYEYDRNPGAAIWQCRLRRRFRQSIHAEDRLTDLLKVNYVPENWRVRLICQRSAAQAEAGLELGKRLEAASVNKCAFLHIICSN